MRAEKRNSLLVILVAALAFSLVAPVASVNAGGQYFLFGVPVTPNPTGACASFGCHCLATGSILGVLVGLGYRQFLGCP